MTTIDDHNHEHQAPDHPPPLLTETDLFQLADEGYLTLSLKPHFATILHRLHSAASTFFTTLDASTKQTIYPPDSGTELGYYVVPEEKEYVSLRSYTTTEQPDARELERLAGVTWHESALLLQRVLHDISHALAIEPDAWDPLLENATSMPASFSNDNPSMLRIFKYLPATGIAERHADIGLLTLCWSPTPGPGLEVLEGKGEEAKWKSVSCSSSDTEPEEGTGQATILIGETLRLLTGNHLRSGVHRVVGNPEGRYSIVFPLRANLAVEQIDLRRFGGQGEVGMKELWRAIRGSRQNVNAQLDIRKEQKEKLERKKAEMRAMNANETGTRMQTGSG